jgi:hypothetical protein
MTTAAELDALIEELTVDAYNDEEQLSGFLVGAEEALVADAGIDLDADLGSCEPALNAAPERSDADRGF